LKKTAAESYRLLGEAYSEYASSQKYDSFSVSKLEISMLQTRNTENQKVRRYGIASIAG